MDMLTFNGNIHIIGLGVAEVAMLTLQASEALAHADCVIGSERQLATLTSVLNTIDREIPTQVFPAFSELPQLIASLSEKTIVVLASGDPLHYGIGRWFSHNICHSALHFYPAVSSIQAACHQLGLSLQDVDVVSLHGRPLEKIRTQLHRNKHLVILTDQYSQPRTLAQECIAAGFDQSRLTVCENLGYQHQRVQQFSAAELQHDTETVFDPLHVTIIQVAGAGGVLPEFPGIPDEHYMTGAEPGKGMISKREVRLAILSLLQPSAQDIIWDVGAGCGGVAIELAYWNERLNVYAIEHHPERLGYLADNCSRFGVSHNCHIIAGRAPEALATLPAPNKVFIGGSDGALLQLLQYTWQQLPVGGVLVASAVIESTQQQLSHYAETLNEQACGKAAEISSVEVAIRRGTFPSTTDISQDTEHAHSLCYQRKLPVEIFSFKKLQA